LLLLRLGHWWLVESGLLRRCGYPSAFWKHFWTELRKLGSESTDILKVVISRVQAILSAFSQHDGLKYNLLG
jgi:hypothetical protein